MNTTSPARRNFLFAAICALGLMLLPIATLSAADKALPLTPSFSKVESTEGTPFVLKLTNDSKDTITVSGKVLLAVVNHSADKARALPDHTIKAGEAITVTGLAADDKVVLSAHGYETLTVSVPFKL